MSMAFRTLLTPDEWLVQHSFQPVLVYCGSDWEHVP